MEPNNPSYSVDHGLNMANLDSISIILTTQVSSSGHLSCVNCGLNVTSIRRHLLEIAEVRNLVQQWIHPQQVSVTSDSLVCHSCWTAASSQLRNPTSQQQNALIAGHRHVCISCGRSHLRIRSHTLRSDCPREDLIRNVIARQIAPRELPRSAQVCHTCWRRTDRAASHSTTELVSDLASLPSLESDVDTVSQAEQNVNTSGNAA